MVKVVHSSLGGGGGGIISETRTKTLTEGIYNHYLLHVIRCKMGDLKYEISQNIIIYFSNRSRDNQDG